MDEIYHTCHWSYEKLDDKLRFVHEIYHWDENQFHDHGNHNIVEVDDVDDENYYVKIHIIIHMWRMHVHVKSTYLHVSLPLQTPSHPST